MDKPREQFEDWWHNNFSSHSLSAKTLCFDAWQASRAALVVKLPKAFDSAKEDASHYEYAYLKSEVEESLDAAGVSYK